MPNLSPNLRVISEKRALCQDLQVCAGTTGETELVLGVKSALQDPFSPATQELGAKVLSLTCIQRPLPSPVQQARGPFLPGDTGPTRTSGTFKVGRCFPKESRV